jgi:hypothetical protein
MLQDQHIVVVRVLEQHYRLIKFLMGFQSTQISSGNILKGEKIRIPRRVLIIVHEARGMLKNT